MHKMGSPRNATAQLAAMATAALAIGIFVADILTPTDAAVAVLYGVVVLLVARFCRQERSVVLVAAGCIGLAVLSYFLSAESVLNAAISIGAIGATSFLALQSRAAEAALREQAGLLDLTHDSIVARRFDDDVITYWNRGAEELYGWDRAEALGKLGSELRKGAAPLPLDEIKAELLRVGRWEGELVNNKQDGTPVVLTSRWALQRDQHGRAAVMLVTSNDITEQKHAAEALRQSEEQWREVFEHNPVMYFMVSPTGTVLSVNGFGAAQLGYTPAELIGQSVLTVFFEEERKIVKDQLATCVEELGRPHNWEIRKIRKDGTVLWVRENAKAVRRSGNDAIILIACEDITERKRAEQRVAAGYAVTRVLAEADSLAAAAPHILRAIGENLDWDWGALWSFDRQREHEGAPLRCACLWHAPGIAATEFAAASQERLQVPGQGRLGQVWRSAKPIWVADAPTEPEFLRAAAATAVGLHAAVIFPILLDTEALGVLEFFSRTSRLPDEEQLTTLSAIGSQIGQFMKRQRAEAALRANEERWRTLFETSSAGMGLFRLDGVCTAANPAFQRMLGRSEEEIVGRNILELHHEDERAPTAYALAQYRSGLLTERHVEKKYVRPDGSPVWLNITTTVVPATENAAPFLQAVYMDVTSRVQFEVALRASEERWRTVFERATVGIVTLDADARYLTANASFQRMTGYTEDELRNLTSFDITHEDDRDLLRTLPHNPNEPVSPNVYEVEKRYRRKDGEAIWAHVNSFGVPATESTPAFFPRIIVDITDRKRAEEALRESEERFRTLVQFSFDVYWESDEEHRFVRQEFAAGFAEAPGPGDEIGKRRWEVPYLEPGEEAWRKHRETLDAHLPFRDFELARPTRDGGKRYVSVSGLPMFDASGRFVGYRGVGRTITERKRTEEALRQAQADLARVNRVMLLGEMTASIAHEVNQPIAAIITNASGGLRWLGARPPNLKEVDQALGRIVRDGNRAGEIIHRVREMVRKQLPVHRTRLDLNEAIREAVALTQAELQRHVVQLQLRLSENLPLVPSDRVQLQQVIINLVMNAVEAMGGRDHNPREITISSGTGPSNELVVEVQDTGPGINPADLDRLFQSFYTTKQDGMGLGLAISRSIIEAHGGRLSVAANEPHGAVFRFVLPVDEPVSEPAEVPHSQLTAEKSA